MKIKWKNILFLLNYYYNLKKTKKFYDHLFILFIQTYKLVSIDNVENKLNKIFDLFSD